MRFNASIILRNIKPSKYSNGSVLLAHNVQEAWAHPIRHHQRSNHTPVHAELQVDGHDGSNQVCDSLDPNAPIQKYCPTQPMVHIHVPKAAGTSLDHTISHILTERHVQLKQGGNYISTTRSGQSFFDWSYAETVPNAQIVTMLRDPVSRAISHFAFYKQFKEDLGKSVQTPLKISQDKIMPYKHFDKYLNDKDTMMKTRDIWQDGQAGVSWFTGTQTTAWGITDSVTREEIKKREKHSLDSNAMMAIAAKRLKNTFWFGILEDLEKSMELLQWQLEYEPANKQPLVLDRKNVHSVAHHRNHHELSHDAWQAPVDANTKAQLKRLMPMDIWFYGYAKQLFDARYNFMKTGKYEDPKVPDFPEVTCQSTRYILKCYDEPKLHHMWHTIEAMDAEQLSLLPEF